MAKIFPDYYSNNSDKFFLFISENKRLLSQKKNHQFKKKKTIEQTQNLYYTKSQI